MRLAGKTAFITGAANGIGKAVALGMAAEGAEVAIVDVHEDNGEKVAAQIRANGGEAVFLCCDVGIESDVKHAVEKTLKRYGKIDILHNNAAIAMSGSITDMDEDSWNRVINTNLSSVFRGCKHVIPHMLRSGGGSIINTASVQAHTGFTGWTAYAAAKGGIISMTRNLAVEFASRGIRVNSISPGTIRTPMLEQVLNEAADGEALLKEWTRIHPMGRIGEMEEVAQVVIFLASDESSFITGEDIRVDGGSVVQP